MFNLSFWRTMFKRGNDNPGYIPEIAPLAARHDLIFGSDIPSLPRTISWRTDMAPRKLQYASPFCVSYTSVHLREYELRKDNDWVSLDPDYTALASGTGRRGNSVQQVMDYGRLTGFLQTTDFDLPVGSVNYSELPLAPPELTPDIKAKLGLIKWKSYSFLNPHSVDEIKAALVKGPIGLTMGLEGVSFNQRKTGEVMPMPKNPFTVYHAVACTGYDERGLEIFDSLEPSGYFVPWGYELTGAFVAEELPVDWREIQEKELTKEIPNNANRYGKVRNYEQEIKVASIMLDVFKKFNNKSVFEAAGRFWTMYIRAVCYGNYSFTDVVNNTYNWRRTGQHIFDFDKERR